MNWTGGRLQRHSRSNSNRIAKAQRQYFAKARLRSRIAVQSRSPSNLSNFCHGLDVEFNPDYWTTLENPSTACRDLYRTESDKQEPSGHQRSTDQLCHEIDEQLKQRIETHSPEPSKIANVTTFEDVKSLLLERSDWVRISSTKPLRMKFPPARAVERLGRQRTERSLQDKTFQDAIPYISEHQAGTQQEGNDKTYRAPHHTDVGIRIRPAARQVQGREATPQPQELSITVPRAMSSITRTPSGRRYNKISSNDKKIEEGLKISTAGTYADGGTVQAVTSSSQTLSIFSTTTTSSASDRQSMTYESSPVRSVNHDYLHSVQEQRNNDHYQSIQQRKYACSIRNISDQQFNGHKAARPGARSVLSDSTGNTLWFSNATSDWTVPGSDHQDKLLVGAAGCHDTDQAFSNDLAQPTKGNQANNKQNDEKQIWSERHKTNIVDPFGQGCANFRLTPLNHIGQQESCNSHSESRWRDRQVGEGQPPDESGQSEDHPIDHDTLPVKAYRSDDPQLHAPNPQPLANGFYKKRWQADPYEHDSYQNLHLDLNDHTEDSYGGGSQKVFESRVIQMHHTCKPRTAFAMRTSKPSEQSPMAVGLLKMSHGASLPLQSIINPLSQPRCHRLQIPSIDNQDENGDDNLIPQTSLILPMTSISSFASAQRQPLRHMGHFGRQMPETHATTQYSNSAGSVTGDLDRSGQHRCPTDGPKLIHQQESRDVQSCSQTPEDLLSSIFDHRSTNLHKTAGFVNIPEGLSWKKLDLNDELSTMATSPNCQIDEQSLQHRVSDFTKSLFPCVAPITASIGPSTPFSQRHDMGSYCGQRITTPSTLTSGRAMSGKPSL